jgi:VanZ family protein
MRLNIERRHIYPVIWLGLITYASVTPSKNFPELKLFPHFDKVVHFGIYFVLALLLAAAFIKDRKYSRSYLLAGLASVITGIVFELIQKYLTTDRSGAIDDILANTLGVLAGITFYHFLIKGKWTERFFFKNGSPHPISRNRR